jgi:hypothetical protein
LNIIKNTQKEHNYAAAAVICFRTRRLVGNEILINRKEMLMVTIFATHENGRIIKEKKFIFSISNVTINKVLNEFISIAAVSHPYIISHFTRWNEVLKVLKTNFKTLSDKNETLKEYLHRASAKWKLFFVKILLRFVFFSILSLLLLL